MVGLIPLFVSLSESEQPSWEMLKLIIESQRNLAMMGITVLVGIAVLITGASWFYYFFVARQGLKRTLEIHKSEVVAKADQAFAKRIEEVREEIAESKKEIVEAVEHKMMAASGEVARLHATDAEQAGEHGLAALWWARALDRFVLSKEARLVGLSLDRVKRALQKCKKLDNEFMKEIEERLASIPKTLYMQEKEIGRILKSLKKHDKLERDQTKKQQEQD